MSSSRPGGRASRARHLRVVGGTEVAASATDGSDHGQAGGVLDEPLTKWLSAATATALSTVLGLRTVRDLLQHYPRRYVNRGELSNIGSLRDGEDVTVVAQVQKTEIRPMQQRKGKILHVTVTDGVDTMRLSYFNPRQLANLFKPGVVGVFAGKVSSYKGIKQLTHPEFESIEGDDEDAANAFATSPLPIYPIGQKLTSKKVRTAVRTVLDVVGPVPDPVPAELLKRRRLPDLTTALRMIHRPAEDKDWRLARKRLQWDEAFVLQAALAERRVAARAMAAVPRHPVPGGLVEQFDARLPFRLTAGQQALGVVIAADLAQAHPMQRLLQGEVGSGKTVVAMRAMLQVVDAGGQAALLAPTEVLAAQHYRTVTALLGPLAQAGMLGGGDRGTRVALLTGSQGVPARRAALLDARSGTAGIVIGTHALLQENVEFFDLGLVVVDEQHRFGVEQRDALRGKAAQPPHVLVMTATPIPRTVAMTVFGDLETSTLTELPSGRAGVTTHVVPTAEKPHYVERAWQRVREEVAKGGQAFVVCPRIGTPPTGAASFGATAPADGPDRLTLVPADDDADGALGEASGATVLEWTPRLRAGPLAGLRVEMLHGRMPPADKDDVMRRFAAGDLDVLVATTVIEVGVDVADATVMVVLDADRFGVSQLHQLRGRVGRGSEPAVCLLMTDLPTGAPARERLDAVAATTDGFELARVDLEQRREGDVLGASQSGRRSSLRLLRVIRDEDLIAAARVEATSVVEADPTLAEHPALRAAITALLDEDRAEFLERT